MKKYISIFLAVLLSIGISLGVAAAELTSCVIMADSASGSPGETVTVAIRIADNPGFTNFSISLDYDREHMTLKSIETGDETYLCGTQNAANIQWEEEDGTRYAYVVSASADAVKGSGILFSVTFEIADDFQGELEVTPTVRYIRNNEALFSVFEEIQATVYPGTISVTDFGDVNGDGIIEYDDVMLAYRAFFGEVELTEMQLAAVDRDGSGTVEEAEYQAIYEAYIGG